jgi:hypothetical protein
MAIPSKLDLQYTGFTYNGQPFVEVDGQPNLTSPGYMGVTWDGQPVTFAPEGIITGIPPVYRRVNATIASGGMGIKKPHLP